MSIINSVLLSAWFQLILLSILFFVYSARVLAHLLYKGYGLGWMLGLFFIFTYSALSGSATLQLGAYDYNLNIIQVFGVSAFAMFLSIGMSFLAYILRGSQRWRSIQTAIVTSIFVIAIFLQVIAKPEVRLMVSLFVLAFGMATLFANIFISRRYAGDELPGDVPYVGYGDNLEHGQPSSRLDHIRQRIIERINRNDVPTNYPQG